MKKISILVALFAIAISLHAQEAVKLSGALTFMTQTNSLFTGGRFSENPALNASINVGYKGFSLMVGRNSDLLDSKSGANLFAISPSYSKDFGRYNVCFALELDIQDYVKDFDLIAPYIVISRKGTLNFDLMGAYARPLQDRSNIWIGRLGVEKSLDKGYSAKLYFLAVDWGGLNYSLVVAFSKEINHSMSLSLHCHLNNFTSDKKQEFGSICLKYSFWKQNPPDKSEKSYPRNELARSN